MSAPETEREDGRAWPWALGLAVVTALLRLIPHPYNLTPVGALGLFAGARLRSWRAFAVPIAVMALSDLGLWLAKGYGPDLFVYACFLLNVVWGRLLLRSGGAGRIVAVSLATSLQFFIVTNFGVWMAASVDPAQMPGGQAVEIRTFDTLPYPVPVRYARSLDGLAACYAQAVPFWRTNAPPLGFLGNQIVGDLFYCGLLFGGFALLTRRGFVGVRSPASPGGAA